MHIYLCFVLFYVFCVIQPFFVKCWTYTNIVFDRIQQVYSFYYNGCETNHDDIYCKGLYINVLRVQYISDVITMLCTMNTFYWCRSCAYVNLCTHHTKFIVLYRHPLRSFFVIGLLYTSYKCPIMGAILYIHRCHIYFQNSELYSHVLFLTILFIFINYG